MKRCLICIGSGVIMGGGKLKADCPHCKGTGNVIDEDEAKRKALDEIKALKPGTDDEEANLIFEKEMKKIERDESRERNGKTKK